MRIITELEIAPENAPTQMTWDDATAYCASLGEGWRLPTKEELNLLYENKDELGGFGGSWLWSSSQSSTDNAWSQSFSYGKQVYGYKDNDSSVRACRAVTRVEIRGHRKRWCARREGQ